MRVMIGPIRDCISLTSRFTFSVVRRIWKTSTVKIITCTTRASAATILKISSHTCMCTPSASLAEATQPHPIPRPGYGSASRLRLPSVSLLRAFHSRNDGILLARRYVFAALNQFIGTLSQFARFALRVFLALVGFFRKKIARLFASFRRKKNAQQGANTQTHDEVRHLGTYVVSHDNLQRLQRQRSTPKVRLQWQLTGIIRSKRLRLVRMLS